MIAKYILIFATFQLVVLQLNAQTFVSQRQSIRIFPEKPVFVTGERRVIIDGDNFEIDLPNKPKLRGTLKFYMLDTTENKKVKVYEIDGGGGIRVGEDNIFVNLFATQKAAYVFFLPNYIEPSDEEKVATKAITNKKVEQITYDGHIELFGEFTANCIREKKVKPLMKELGIFEILGQPDKINKTETANGISRQYIYKDTYIYTENGIVTTIQSRE